MSKSRDSENVNHIGMIFERTSNLANEIVIKISVVKSIINYSQNPPSWLKPGHNLRDIVDHIEEIKGLCKKLDKELDFTKSEIQKSL